MSDIHQWTAIETAARIRSREVSVCEVTEAHITRMEALNPALNAITTPVHEAMDVARALDNAGIPENPGPLFGVPVTTKINIDQAGYPNSNGVPANKDAIGDGDSPLVSNLRSGGAVIIGRTNTPEFSMRWFTSNPLHGISLNPWNRDITPGGSSGAAAATVACGIGSIAHGNDLGGSLRYPAMCCGVASIRPSLGRIPAMNPNQSANGVERGPLTQSLSVQGPIARTIADVRAGLKVMSMRDSRDPLWVSAPDSGRTRGENLKIGYAINPFGGSIDAAVETAMAHAIQGLRDVGAVVCEVAPPHASDLLDLWGALLFSENDHLTAGLIEATGSAQMNTYFSAFRARFDHLDGAGLFGALQQRLIYKRLWSQMFDDVDLLLLPTSLMRPFRNNQDFDAPDTLSEIIDAQAPLCAINLLGLPSVALPTHLEGRTPLGVQLVGPMHDDWFALDVAERLERELGTLWQDLPDPLTS